MSSHLDGWLFVLKNMSKLEKIPLYLRKPIFEKLFKLAEYSKLSKEDKNMYDISLKRKWDNHGALTYARQEGHQEGVAEGERKKALDAARKMLSKGYKKKDICDILGLTIEDIEKL